MKTILIIPILLCMSLHASSQFVNYRQVLIFGNEINKQMVTEQSHLLDSAKDGLKERDLKIVKVPAVSELYKKYKIKAGAFMVILVGKDGGEKHRSATLLQVHDLFSIIDAMPMRQAEMKKKQ